MARREHLNVLTMKKWQIYEYLTNIWQICGIQTCHHLFCIFKLSFKKVIILKALVNENLKIIWKKDKKNLCVCIYIYIFSGQSHVSSWIVWNNVQSNEHYF